MIVAEKETGFKDTTNYEWFIKCRDSVYEECQPKDYHMDTVKASFQLNKFQSGCPVSN